jgi:hypothetical protein
MKHEKCNHRWREASGLLNCSGKKTFYHCNDCIGTKIETRADEWDKDTKVMTYLHSEVIIDSYGQPELLRYWQEKVSYQ